MDFKFTKKRLFFTFILSLIIILFLSTQLCNLRGIVCGFTLNENIITNEEYFELVKANVVDSTNTELKNVKILPSYPVFGQCGNVCSQNEAILLSIKNAVLKFILPILVSYVVSCLIFRKNPKPKSM